MCQLLPLPSEPDLQVYRTRRCADGVVLQIRAGQNLISLLKWRRQSLAIYLELELRAPSHLQ